MKILLKTFAIMLAVTIPLTSICLSINIAVRMPDVYQYEFKATNALKNLELGKGNDEMSEFISDFMMGKEKEFQIWKGDEDRPSAAFSEEETAAALRARMIANIVAVVGVLSIAGMTAAFVTLWKNELNGEIRKQFKKGVAIYAAVMIIYFVAFAVTSRMGYSFGDILGYAPSEEDLLPQIITASLINRICFVIAAISGVIMAIMGYFVFKVTEPKKIFSREY
ncbi:MAG: hypothetical protein ACI4LO_00670 [Anaerovoracaceae bacterium]